MSGSVTQLSDFRQRDTVKALEILLELARSGRLRGAILTCKHDRGTGVYVLGEFKGNPQLEKEALEWQITVLAEHQVESAQLRGDRP